MWCTAPFFHAAGRQIVERSPGQWEAVPAGQPAQQVVKPFDFVPGRVTIDSRGRTTFQEGGQLGDPQVDRDVQGSGCGPLSGRHDKLLEGVVQKATGRLGSPQCQTQPVCLRAESLTLLPQSQPVVFVHVRNTSNTPYAGQVALQAPAAWRLTPAAHDVQAGSGRGTTIGVFHGWGERVAIEHVSGRDLRGQ